MKKIKKIVKSPFDGNARVNLIDDGIANYLKLDECRHISNGIESENSKIRENVLHKY